MQTPLIAKNVAWYGYGGTDICDEWYHNGNYFLQIGKGHRPFQLNHNYYADIYIARDKDHKKCGYRTYIYLCLTASNSKEIVLQEWVKWSTLKEAKQGLCDFINTFDNEIVGPKIIIDRYLKENARPVLGFVDGKIEIFGTTYGNMGSDMSSQNDSTFKSMYLYYHKDLVSFRSTKTDDRAFYSISDRGYGGEQFSIDKMEPSSSGYSSGGVSPERKAELAPLFMEAIKKDERFSNLYWKLYSKLNNQ